HRSACSRLPILVFGSPNAEHTVTADAKTRFFENTHQLATPLKVVEGQFIPQSLQNASQAPERVHRTFTCAGASKPVFNSRECVRCDSRNFSQHLQLTVHTTPFLLVPIAGQEL